MLCYHLLATCVGRASEMAPGLYRAWTPCAAQKYEYLAGALDLETQSTPMHLPRESKDVCLLPC